MSQVIKSDRLRDRMAERELSQNELARRVGVSQQTIHKLVSGGGYGSKHLHRIARELGTTPAYLEGETDDPDADAPSAPELTYQQREMVGLLEEIPPKDLGAITHVLRLIAAKAPPPPQSSGAQAVNLPDLLPSEEALAQMFEALLMAMDRSVPLAEQARLLAQRLPIGLSQLQDLLPAGWTPEDAMPSQPPSTPVPARP